MNSRTQEQQMSQAERRMLLNLYSIVPHSEWTIWYDFSTEQIRLGFNLLAIYFVSVDGGEFSDGELPSSFDAQIKGRVSQMLYTLRQVGVLD